MMDSEEIVWAALEVIDVNSNVLYRRGEKELAVL
jgi:hypothetical protein